MIKAEQLKQIGLIERIYPRGPQLMRKSALRYSLVSLTLLFSAATQTAYAQSGTFGPFCGTPPEHKQLRQGFDEIESFVSERLTGRRAVGEPVDCLHAENPDDPNSILTQTTSTDGKHEGRFYVTADEQKAVYLDGDTVYAPEGEEVVKWNVAALTPDLTPPDDAEIVPALSLQNP